MRPPKFSIVIPTRERADTLRFTLQTCLTQDFDDYEIVVCDNCSSPAVKSVVDGFASPRIQYVRSDKVLSMVDNWNLAISHVRGEFVSFIGSDDGLMPYALRELDHLIAKTGAKIMTWSLPVYVWPTVIDTGDANYLALPLDRFIISVNARERIAAVLRGVACVSTLPNIYHGLIHRELIDALRQRTQTVFATRNLDTYVAFAFAYLAGSYTAIGVPMSLNAFSATSGSASFTTAQTQSPLYREQQEALRRAGLLLHPWVPNLPLLHTVMADSFLQAKEAVFPSDDDLVLDRKRLASLYVSQLPTIDATERCEYIARIRASLADAPELLAWFDATDPMSVPPAPPFRYRNWGLGYNGHCLCLNADQFGVTDVAGAVELCAKLLGYQATKITYDLPRRWEQLGGLQEHLTRSQAEIARLQAELTTSQATAAALQEQVAEQQSHLADARRQAATAQGQLCVARRTLDRAWSCLPYRLMRKARGAWQRARAG